MNKAPGRGTIIGLAAVVVFSGTAQGATESPTDASASGGLEEITVTANRREERLQDVPISVAAFSAAQLNASGVQNIQDLAQITPGLTMTQQSGALTPFIRGIGAVDNTVGQEAAVSTYVDGVYYPSVYGALFTFNNIERVEVEKGPQGTLFGRNATGGLIQVITRAPSHDTELEGSAWYGNYGSSDAKFYATTGLTTDLAADLAVIYHHQSEGWGHDLFNDQQVGFLPNTAGVRNKWLYTPTDRTNISVSLDYLNSDNGDIGNAKNGAGFL
jgi:iron complex outermembrane recepter protein